MMATRFVPAFLALALATLLLDGLALAGTVESGNELARRLMYSQKGQEKEMEKDAVGNLFFFRYLKISEKKAITNTIPTTYKFKTQEPGSGMYVEFVITKKESLKIAEGIQEGEAMAVTGRIKTISKANNSIAFESVRIEHKDVTKPKVGKELLSDIDSKARYGTDTSSGEEKVIKNK